MQHCLRDEAKLLEVLRLSTQPDSFLVYVNDQHSPPPRAQALYSLVRHPVVLPGAPVPKGADAVVQIENTEQLPQRQDGEKCIKIVKVLFTADVFYTSADWGGFQIARCIQLVASLLNMQRTAVKTRLARIETWTLIMRVLTSHGFLS